MIMTFFINSIDFMSFSGTLNFEVGGTTTHCYTIIIIPDITYEGEEDFGVGIYPEVETERINITLRTTWVIIHDYNGE